MKSPKPDKSIYEGSLTKLYERFNEPVIPMKSIVKWLNGFEDEDKRTALKLLEAIEYHSQPRLVRETRLLHGKVQERLASDGFDEKTLADVDFSREFTCKSGDVVSYIYRKSNLIPVIDFKTFDELSSQTEKCAGRYKDRALLILDDYIGTGSQFIFQFIGRSEEDIRVLNCYRKVYLVCYIIHEDALKKFRLLADGKIEEALAIEEEQFPNLNMYAEKKSFRRALSKLDWKNIELVYLDVDKPILDASNVLLSMQEKIDIERLLDKFKHEGYSGTSFLMGNHTFFYGAPNSLPEILWPLFKRIEDFTVYTEGTDGLIGIGSDVIRYDIDEVL